jgi:enhancing lycopene biosynthesis protein 2
MKKKVGVLLSGCGVFDGTEIHEAVLTLLFLDREGAQAICFAPNIPITKVADHVSQKDVSESRNVLVESARICRGEIQDLKNIQANDLDALIIPGGYGAAKNLSEFAFKGPLGEVQPEVKRIITEMLQSKKPIGALCIAPATVGMALKGQKVTMTIGKEEGAISALEAIGIRHQLCTVDEIVIDEDNKIVTTPAYMLGPGIKDVAVGIEKLVKKILSMV